MKKFGFSVLTVFVLAILASSMSLPGTDTARAGVIVSAPTLPNVSYQGTTVICPNGSTCTSVPFTGGTTNLTSPQATASSSASLNQSVTAVVSYPDFPQNPNALAESQVNMFYSVEVTGTPFTTVPV